MLNDDLLGFIRAAIRSTWSLELLLLLHKQQDRAFAADELVRTLRASPRLVANCLEHLQAAGLLVDGGAGSWRFEPATAQLRDLTDKLERAYAERPVAVINAIVGSPNDRLKSFADAFRLPKKGD
jgi:hypothetical protein